MPEYVEVSSRTAMSTDPATTCVTVATRSGATGKPPPASDQEQGAAQTGRDEQDDDGDEADHDSGTAALG